MIARDHYVYRLYSFEGELVYVGYTRRPRKRWQQHHHERPGMVTAAATYRLVGPYTEESARRIEAAAILSEQPLFNGGVIGTWPERQALAEKYPPFPRTPKQFKPIVSAARVGAA